ncbi:MAG: GTPase HflX [bacterium]|nr:GTPase HflX [bacterium]
MQGRNQNGLIEIERPPVTETAVLVRLVLPGDTDDEVDESLEEMERLAWTAGADVRCTVIQRRAAPCPASLVGAGKVEQIRRACDELEADVVFFDSDLTPSQGVNLERAIEVKVLDRTQLILDIFAQHAHTNEGKHQVELAQLQYLLPRLTGRGAVMRQQGGIGVRGPGEQKLEVDRRRIRKRIDRLTAELDTIRKNRRIQRQRRSEGSMGSVALVGYTNAGKSSLLNALAGSDVLVEDKLFATLDPRSRRCALPGGRETVISDTVGFIRKLPHSLVAAFRATLEEVNEADLLLLVADVAHPAVEEHIGAVFTVLDEIEVGDTPMLKVYNKTDLADPGDVQVLMRGDPGDCMAVSARTGEGLAELLTEIERRLSATQRRVLLRIPQSEAGVLSRIHGNGRVLEQHYDEDDILVEAELDPAVAAQLQRYIA